MQFCLQGVSQRTVRRIALKRSLCGAVLLALPCVVVSCSLVPGGSEWELRRGVIEFYDDPVIIEHADTLGVGSSGSVAVSTYGGGCIRQGVSEVTINGMTAVIEPFDSVHVAAEGCTDELRVFRHVVVVQFTERGTATLRIVGLSRPADNEITVTRHVVVQ